MAVKRAGAKPLNPVQVLAASLPTEDEARAIIFERIKQEGEILAQHAMGVAGHAQNSWRNYGPPDADKLAEDIAAFATAAGKLHKYMRDFHAAVIARNQQVEEEPPF
jgi:hypothetical protein